MASSLHEGAQMLHVPQQCHIDEDRVVGEEEGTRGHGSNQPVQQVDVELMGLGRHIVIVLFLRGQAEHPRQ